MRVCLFFFLFCLTNYALMAQQSSARARDLGIPFNGTTGKFNAITDVPGVLVGYKTLVTGEGNLVQGKGPVRTGVTVILPTGKTNAVYAAGYFIFNGDGEMTGLPITQDYGIGATPIGITNTNSVGVVRDALGEWSVKNYFAGDRFDFTFGLPVAAETWDGGLNDINGFHVKKEHVFEALDMATTGRIAEGNVGGGTGMVCYEFKGGTGTASRVITINGKTYTVGVLVQANFGRRSDLVIAGVPVGKVITDLPPEMKYQEGSIIAIVGTDAPLTSSQLNLVSKRVALGVGRTGTYGGDGSGDIFFSFSTRAPLIDTVARTETFVSLMKSSLNPVYRATVEATEEAIINAMVAARTMEGINRSKVYAIPHDRLKEVLRQYNRLNEVKK